ncbi:hypothetical protein Micbo1qcDRAFT_180840 [Microdochium bolleyi]|uniref:Uncharacterized protein n=1 Tax=Microdochium bolleyi TaxID=196109 RepID=A0A136IKB3_9PEZI|nr:hypothetical protein Micbo1qcDRAFT_180840 [Microdochium bolleyi]
MEAALMAFKCQRLGSLLVPHRDISLAAPASVPGRKVSSLACIVRQAVPGDSIWPFHGKTCRPLVVPGKPHFSTQYLRHTDMRHSVAEKLAMMGEGEASILSGSTDAVGYQIQNQPEKQTEQLVIDLKVAWAYEFQALWLWKAWRKELPDHPLTEEWKQLYCKERQNRDELRNNMFAAFGTTAVFFVSWANEELKPLLEIPRYVAQKNSAGGWTYTVPGDA